jgi:hypothetical protein
VRWATSVYSMGFGSPERAQRSVSWDGDSGWLLWKVVHQRDELADHQIRPVEGSHEPRSLSS